MAMIPREQMIAMLKNAAKKISETDFKKILDNSKGIIDKVTGAGPLKKFLSDCELLLSLIKDYVAGKYRKIPWGSITAIAAALIYVLSPIDLIPDLIPVIGLTDDAVVLAVCLDLVKKDLSSYEKWKAGTDQDSGAAQSA